MKQEDMLLSIDDFDTPKVIKNLELMNLKIIRLLLLEPGTYPDQPDRGFGLQSKYRYMTFDESTLLEFKMDLKRCIDTWLPIASDVDVYISVKNKVLNIGVKADEVFYEYTYDGKDLKEATLEDIRVGDPNGSIIRS